MGTGGGPPVIVVGAGGFGREAAEVVRATDREFLGFLDDDTSRWGEELSAGSVLGGIDRVGDFDDAQVVVTTGHPGNYFSRKQLVGRLGLAPERFATLVHPAASLGDSVHIGVGSVILASVTATADVQVGEHVVVMPQVVLTHDDRIGDFVTFGAGALLAGRVRVSEGAYIGAGAAVREDIAIGSWALVGMGSVVTTDVPAGEIWAGVPARFLRRVEVPVGLQAGT